MPNYRQESRDTRYINTDFPLPAVTCSIGEAAELTILVGETNLASTVASKQTITSTDELTSPYQLTVPLE